MVNIWYRWFSFSLDICLAWAAIYSVIYLSLAKALSSLSLKLLAHSSLNSCSAFFLYMPSIFPMRPDHAATRSCLWYSTLLFLIASRLPRTISASAALATISGSSLFRSSAPRLPTIPKASMKSLILLRAPIVGGSPLSISSNQPRAVLVIRLAVWINEAMAKSESYSVISLSSASRLARPTSKVPLLFKSATRFRRWIFFSITVMAFLMFSSFLRCFSSNENFPVSAYVSSTYASTWARIWAGYFSPLALHTAVAASLSPKCSFNKRMYSSDEYIGQVLPIALLYI